MMANDADLSAKYDKFFEAPPPPVDNSPSATARVAAAQNLNTPQQGADAAKYGPPTGINPEAALAMAQQVKERAKQQEADQVIQVSPPVRSFTGRSQVNATVASQSMPSLARIGELASDFATGQGKWWLGQLAQSYKDFHTPFEEASKQFEAADKKGQWWNAIAGFNLINSYPAGLFDTLINPAARTASAIDPTVPTFGGLGGKGTGALGSQVLTTGLAQGLLKAFLGEPLIEDNQKLSEAHYAAMFSALTFFGGAGSKATKAGGPVDLEGEGGPRGPPHITPQGPVYSPWGYATDVNSKTANFATVRDAAQFIRQHSGGDTLDRFTVQSTDGGISVHRAFDTAPAPGVHPDSDAVHMQIADMRAKQVEELQGAVAEDPMHSVAPAKMEEFLNQDSAISEHTAYVDPQQIISLREQGHNDLFAEQSPDILAAVQSGEPVAIPLGTYLTETAGKPFAAELNAATRFGEQGVSQNEGKDLGKIEHDDLMPAKEEIEGKPGVNVRRMAGMLGPQLYGDPEHIAAVTGKEVLQNSFDAIKQAMADHGLASGHIHIELKSNDRTITFHDNGVGMAPDLLGGKFLQIAGSEKGENASGGFGIAKMLFLYGNNALHVQTLKNGVYSEMKTSGPELMNALEEGAKPIITVKRGAEIGDAERALFPEGHGTRISLEIPKDYTDTKTGEKKDIPFPYGVDQIPAIKNSPLFAPVHVTTKNWRGKPEPVEGIGSHFPAHDFTTFANVKFRWGTARIYISREPVKGKYDGKVHILSNGLWQFTEELPANPQDPWGSRLPFTIYVDVNPLVKPEHAGYPFGFNRQAFTESAAKDFNQIKRYLQAIYGNKQLQNEAEAFGSVRYLRSHGYSPEQSISPEVPQTHNPLNSLNAGDQVEVRDGKLIVNGKVLPELTEEDLKTSLPKADELKIDQSKIRAHEIMVHDNTLLTEHDPNGDGFGDDVMPFSSAMERDYGEEWDNFLRIVGDTFLELRDQVADLMGYGDLLDEAVGISFDKTYRGVSIKVPFSGMFINPVAAEFEHPVEQAFGMIGTMIHELAHYKVRSHNASFPAEMQRIYIKLLASGVGGNFRFVDFQQEFVEKLAPFYHMMMEVRKRFDDSSVANRGKSFEDSREGTESTGGSEGDSGELGSARQGTEGGPGVPSGDGSGAGPSEAKPEPPGVPTGGDKSVGETVADISQATDQLKADLDELEKELFLTQLFEGPKSAGMTSPEFKQYSRELAAWRQKATERLVRKMVNQFNAERTPEWKDQVARFIADVEKEITSLPAVKALMELQYGEGPLGEPLERPGLKLNPKEIAEDYGKTTVDNLPKSVFRRGENVGADQAAELFGYDSAESMLTDLLGLEERRVRGGFVSSKVMIKAEIKAEAERRTEQTLGFHPTKANIRAEAEEAIGSPEITDLLSKQNQYLAELTGLPFSARDIYADTDRLFADTKASKGATPKSYVTAMMSSGRKVETALRGKKWNAAFLAKQDQMRNHIQYRRSLEFAKVYAREIKKWKGYAGDVKRASVEQSYFDAVHAELRQYGFNVPRGNIEYRRELWEQEARERGDTVIPLEPIRPVPVKNLTVEEFMNLKNRIDNMIHLGREAQRVIAANRLEDFETAVAEAERGVAKVTTKRLPNEGVVRRNWWSEITSALSQVQPLFDRLDDNNANGIFNRVFRIPAVDAAGKQMELRELILDKVQGLYKAMPGKSRAFLAKNLPAGHGLLNPVTKEEMKLKFNDLIGIALNLGTDLNKWHLMEGGWGWSEENINAALEKLKSEHLDFINNILKFLERELWPRIAEHEFQSTGIVPVKEQATPFTIGNRKFDGGYYPLTKDIVRADLMGRSNPDISELFKDKILTPSTPTGFLQKRMQAQYPVSLNWQNTLFHHINDITRRIAYSQYAASVMRFISDPRIKNILARYGGPNAKKMIYNSLIRQTGAEIIDPKAIAAVNDFVRQWRENFYLVRATGRLAILFEHAAAISQGFQVAGEGTIARGYVRWLANPFVTTVFAEDSSAYLRARHTAVDRDMADLVRDLNAETKGVIGFAAQKLGFSTDVEAPLRWTKRMATSLLSFVNHNTIAVPQWTGAYYDALAGKAKLNGTAQPAMDHDQAVAFADKVVSLAHGSGLEMDMSAVQSGLGNEFFRLINVFYSYHGNQFNLQKGATNRVLNGREMRERAEGFRQMFWVIMAAIVGSIVGGYETSKLWGKKATPQSQQEWLVDALMGALAREVPMGAATENARVNYMENHRIDFSLSPAYDIPEKEIFAIKDLSAMMGHGKMTSHPIQDLIEAPGYLVGFPGAAQIGESAQGLYDIRNPNDIHKLEGVLHGPHAEHDPGTHSRKHYFSKGRFH